MKQSIFTVFPEAGLKNKQVILWGSGSGYKRWSKTIDFKATAIIDNNTSVWGTKIDNIPVFPPDYLGKTDRGKNIIFILSMFYEEIKVQVQQFGFEENQIYNVKDIERVAFSREKADRQKVFFRVKEAGLQKYIENLEQDLQGVSYRKIKMLPILMPYIALLTNYLFLKESNHFLFPPPLSKEYTLQGEGPILFSTVWHAKQRPDLYKLIKASVSNILADKLTELKAKDPSEESNEGRKMIFLNRKIASDADQYENVLIRCTDIFSGDKYHLLSKETEWVVEFVRYFMNIIDQTYGFFKNHRFDAYITGYANMAEENIRVQVAKELGLKTYGLQHGTFGREYEFDKVPFSHVYKYPTVDKLLSWGTYSKEIVDSIKVDDTVCVVAGHPLYKQSLEEQSFLKKHVSSFLKHRCFVVAFIGPGEREFKINQALLTFADQLANRLGITYVVKMHPHNKVQKKEFMFDPMRCHAFIIDERSVQSYFPEIDFILTTSSTVIQEAVKHYIPTFVYNIHPAVQSICGPLQTIFDEYSQLEKMCDNLLNQETYHHLLDHYAWMGNQYIQSFSGQQATDVYKRLFTEN